MRGMLPAPFIYVGVAWGYLALFDPQPFFGERAALAMAVAAAVAAPVWGVVVYRTAVARNRADARLAQTLLALAHGPGVAGFVLAVGSAQPWWTLAFGAEGLALLLIVRAKVEG